MMILFVLGLSPLHTLIRDKTGSALGAAVLHGVNNSFGGLALLVIAGGSDLLVGVPGVAGVAALALVNLGVYVTGVWKSEREP